MRMDWMAMYQHLTLMANCVRARSLLGANVKVFHLGKAVAIANQTVLILMFLVSSDTYHSHQTHSASLSYFGSFKARADIS